MMKNKRWPALLLALSLCLSCLAGSVCAQTAARPARPGGEVRRVIVRLEGEPAAAQTEQTRISSAARIAAQHAGFRSSLTAAGIAYSVDYDYGVLLNGMALTVSAGELERLAALPGVRSVLAANHYDPPTVVQQEAAADQATEAFLLHRGETQGSGTVIAVLDTGISPAHEAFGVYSGMLEQAKLSESAAREKIAGLGYGSWLSRKIPFAYDYWDLDDDAADDAAGAAGHGTHVAGIAAGYARSEDGALRFCGAAPDAQLLAMKVFSSGEDAGTDTAVCFKALEDAYLLGADIVNLSLGAPSGFSRDQELEDELFGDVYALLRERGVAVAAAAGNEGSMAEGASHRAGPGWVTADYADYGTLNSPASYGENIAVASAETDSYPIRVLEAGDRDIRFYDADEQFYDAFRRAGTLEYSVIPGYGRPEDYQDLMISGRIALVSRGEISFQEKLSNAARAGAVGLLVYNNEPGAVYMSIQRYEIPAAAISGEDGEYLISLAELQTPEAPVQDPGDSSENLQNIYGRISSQEDFTSGSYLIVNEAAGLAFNPDAEEVNAPGNALPVTIRWGRIEADEGLRNAALVYDNITFLNSTSSMNCSGNEDEIRMSNETPEDLIATVSADGSAEILCRGCAFRYHPEENVFRFYLPGSPVRSDPRANVVLYRRGFLPAALPTSIGQISFPDRWVELENPNAGRMSDFSSMGVTPDLRLKPTAAGLGGSVCSAQYQTENGYTVMSGTSMATPHFAGSLACVLQYLAEKRPELDAKARMELAEALLVSTSKILTDENGVCYSPRKQGAGLIDPEAACKARICVMDPVLSLGDEVSANYFLDFRVRNLTDQALSYQVDVSCLRDLLARSDDAGSGLYNTLRSEDISKELYVQDNQLLVIPAGEERTVSLVLMLSQRLREAMEKTCSNGFFLDGFVTLNEAEPACSGQEDCPGKRFTDMPRKGNWAHPGIDYALRHKLFSGTSATTFSPQGTMDRAMTVTVLYAMAGRPETEVEERFTDVKPSKYYAKAVTWAAKNGIVSGYSDGSFRPKRPVSREQLAVILKGYAEFAGVSTGARADLSRFPDQNKVHSYARQAMQWAVAEGILSGVSSGGVTYLRPQGNATRAQVATILMSFTRKCIQASGEAHAAFSAFCGEWSKGPILERHDWREIVDAAHKLDQCPEGETQTWAELGAGWLDFVDFELNTQVNLAWLLDDEGVRFLGDNPLGVTDYLAERCALRPDGTQTVLMQPMLLRNARHLIMTATNAETGELYAVDDTEYLPKAYWDPESLSWQSTGAFFFDGTDLEGNALPGGTRVEIRFYANLDWKEAYTDWLGTVPPEQLLTHGRECLVWNYMLYVDDTAPALRDLCFEQTGTLRFTASDDRYLAFARLRPERKPELDEDGVLIQPDCSPVWEQAFAESEAGAVSSVTVEGLEPGEYRLEAWDYAGNKSTVVLGLGSKLYLLPEHL